MLIHDSCLVLSGRVRCRLTVIRRRKGRFCQIGLRSDSHLLRIVLPVVAGTVEHFRPVVKAAVTGVGRAVALRRPQTPVGRGSCRAVIKPWRKRTSSRGQWPHRLCLSLPEYPSAGWSATRFEVGSAGASPYRLNPAPKARLHTSLGQRPRFKHRPDPRAESPVHPTVDAPMFIPRQPPPVG